ncbi:MAG: metallophosphoesterase [Actinobacteria bacterium]|nr:MAG: metallophosphoesterase [Actinomycetota bacterium]
MTPSRDGIQDVALRVAAAGDVHIRDSNRDEVARSFRALEGEVDLVLLAGDLTTHGEPAQAELFAEVCRDLSVPVIAVLGNHDLHMGRGDDVRRVLEEAGGVTVLERETTVVEARGVEVGIVGLKGFVGGFGASNLPDFGEPQLREVYATTTADVAALDEGLRAISMCPFRIVLLHYAPTADTLEGEPVGIWAFLGSDRLAAPILEHVPDLVLHGHAHAGAFEGRIGEAPVYNVSVPVMGRDFWVFELSSERRPTTPIH